MTSGHKITRSCVSTSQMCFCLCVTPYSGPVFVMCTASQNLRRYYFGMRPCPPSCPAHGKQPPGPGDEIKIARIFTCHSYVGRLQHTMACALVQGQTLVNSSRDFHTFLHHHAVFKFQKNLRPSVFCYTREGVVRVPWHY